MTIVVERVKKEYLQNDSCPAYVDLTGMHLRWVSATGAATGSMKVTTPAAQGALVYAILDNAPAINVQAALVVDGIWECVANEAINAGSELTVVGASGKVEAAASGDFVCAIAREAALEADHLISVLITKGYYKP